MVARTTRDAQPAKARPVPTAAAMGPAISSPSGAKAREPRSEHGCDDQPYGSFRAEQSDRYGGRIGTVHPHTGGESRANDGAQGLSCHDD